MATDRTWMAPLTGIAFIVVLIVGFTVGGEPPSVSDSTPEEIVSFYTDDDGAAFGAALIGISATLFVFFAGTLRKVLRQAEGEGGTLSAVTLVGAAIFAVGAGIDGSISFALSESADKIDPIAVQALQAYWDNDFLPLAIGLQVFFLALGLSVLRHGALPGWIGWISLLVGIVALTPVGFVAFMAGGLLVVTISVMLTMRARAAGAQVS